MKSRHLRHLIGATGLTLALGGWGSALAADDFRGIWRGTWPDGQTTELTVVRIDDDGNAHGAYCHPAHANEDPLWAPSSGCSSG